MSKSWTFERWTHSDSYLFAMTRAVYCLDKEAVYNAIVHYGELSHLLLTLSLIVWQIHIFDLRVTPTQQVRWPRGVILQILGSARRLRCVLTLKTLAFGRQNSDPLFLGFLEAAWKVQVDVEDNSAPFSYINLPVLPNLIICRFFAEQAYYTPHRYLIFTPYIIHLASMCHILVSQKKSGDIPYASYPSSPPLSSTLPWFIPS